MIQLKDAQSLPQITLRDATSQSGSVLMGDGKVLFSVPSEKYVFAPSMLFSDGEAGAWYDPGDSATLFQDAAATTPAGVGDPVGLVLDKSGNDNHAIQSTSNARPTLQEDAAGNRYLSFDGVDDYLRAPLPSILYQPISYGLAVNFGGDTQFVIDGHGANAMSLASVSGIRLYSSGAGFSAPMSLGENNVVLSRGNGATSAIRVNGSEVSGVIGAGAITAITLGASGSLTLPLSGRIYQAVILGGVFGGSDRSLESYLSTKSGVVL